MTKSLQSVSDFHWSARTMDI